MNLKKIAIGFGLFFAYFLVARIIENKVGVVRKITSLNAPEA